MLPPPTWKPVTDMLRCMSSVLYIYLRINIYVPMCVRICVFICTYPSTVYSFLLNFWSKAILLGGSGNLNELECPVLIGPRSLVWGPHLGEERIQEGLVARTFASSMVSWSGGLLGPGSLGISMGVRAAVQILFSLTF